MLDKLISAINVTRQSETFLFIDQINFSSVCELEGKQEYTTKTWLAYKVEPIAKKIVRLS